MLLVYFNIINLVLLISCAYVTLIVACVEMVVICVKKKIGMVVTWLANLVLLRLHQLANL